MDARRLSLPHQEAHDLVADLFDPALRAVEHDKRIAHVFRRKLSAFVEGDLEPRRVRLEQDIRDGNRLSEVGTLALMGRVPPGEKFRAFSLLRKRSDFFSSLPGGICPFETPAVGPH